jgi:hypothetical protein
MDLIELKRYLHDRRIAPLQDMALHFKVDTETVRPMLDIWINKGKVRKQPGATAGACKGCCKCDPATIEVYEWIG